MACQASRRVRCPVGSLRESICRNGHDLKGMAEREGEMKSRTKLSGIIIASPCFLMGALVANHGSTFEVWMGLGLQVFALIFITGIAVEFFSRKKRSKT